jgi:signal transduction histidine kinase
VRLAQRLLLGSLALLLTFILVVVAVSGDRLESQLERMALDRLTRSARLAATEWQQASDPDQLADTLGAILGVRITLVRSDGRIAGDSEAAASQLGALENHAERPEIREALDSGSGWSRRASTSVGREQLYVAILARDGVARASIDLTETSAVVRQAQWALIGAGAIALLAAAVLAVLFARGIAKPVTELRDVAQALAAGDLSRRPALAAPGEIGDLAVAIHRMAEQLDSRLRALETDELLLGATIESLSEGVIVIAHSRKVVRANHAARRLLALPDPLPFASDLLPRDRPLREALADALAGRATDEMELTVGGRVLLARASSLGPAGAMLAFRDVTAARRLEATRRDFVANVSHELKTPLTVIGGFAETLRDDELDPEHRRRFAAAIENSAQRMQRVVDDLLDLSRIESGGWKPSPVRLDLAAVIGDALLPCQPSAERKGLVLDVELPPDLTTIHADPTALRQILGNLVDNAIRYTTDGRITAFAEPAPDGVWIGVRDTGIGIAPEHLPRIFERFYRVDAARSREAGGTGLGLAIVKHLTEAHGGRVRAESAPGRGTTIAAYFPSAVTAA